MVITPYFAFCDWRPPRRGPKHSLLLDRAHRGNYLVSDHLLSTCQYPSGASEPRAFANVGHRVRGGGGRKRVDWVKHQRCWRCHSSGGSRAPTTCLVDI